MAKLKIILASLMFLLAIEDALGQIWGHQSQPADTGSYIEGSRMNVLNGQPNRGRNNFRNQDSPVIINGFTVTDRSQYPWMVRLECLDTGNCGGVIISTNRILTAAHCVASGSLGSLRLTGVCTAYYGSPELSSTISNTSIVYHPSYNPSDTLGFRNDLAVLKLTSALALGTSNVNKINLPSSTANFQDQPVSIAGWGITEDGTTSDPVLKAASTTVRTDSVCGANWNCAGGAAIYDSSTQICYSGLGVNGICSGDSGGPVVSGTGTAAVLVGINSFVRGGSEPAGCPTTTTTAAPPSFKAQAVSRFISVLQWFVSAGNSADQERSAGTDSCRIDTPSVGVKVASYLTWINSQ